MTQDAASSPLASSTPATSRFAYDVLAAEDEAAKAPNMKRGKDGHLTLNQGKRLLQQPHGLRRLHLWHLSLTAGHQVGFSQSSTQRCASAREQSLCKCSSRLKPTDRMLAWAGVHSASGSSCHARLTLGSVALQTRSWSLWL